MTIARVSLVLVLVCVMCAAPVSRVAAQQAQPSTFYSGDQGSAQDRGVVRGTIAGVDYGRGEIAINNGSKRVAVTVLPSTSIFRGRQELGLSDLTTGMHVEVSISEIGHRMVAQIIRIK
jgi:hypothetical protein